LKAITKQDFALRASVWTDTHLAPVADGIRHFAGLKERGQPPVARVFLRDVAEEHAEQIAQAALASIIQGLSRREGLTALAEKTGRLVAKVTGKPMDSDGVAIATGYWLLSLVCLVTEAAEIVDKHGDRPQKVDGGVKLTPTYELVVTDGKFLADAVEFGSVGMPSYSKTSPAPWTEQKVGGIKGQEGGMVHSAGAQMRGVTPDTSPALYDAVNAAQAVAYRVNQTVAPVVLSYDAAKAYEWLLAHFIGSGMDPIKAAAKAKEASRI
jgi:hypothetical protein